MKVAQVAKPNAPLETVARASDVVAVLGNGGLGHLAAATGAGASPETIELNPLYILGARARGLASGTSADSKIPWASARSLASRR
jgi:hypothetical protein